MKEAGRAGLEAAALNRRLERLAAEGEWSRMREVADRRDRLLGSVPAAMRREALEAAFASTRRCLHLAQAAWSESAAGLRELGLRRLAAASYRQHASNGHGEY